MAEQYATQDLQSPIKNNIEAHFSLACEGAARLRTIITTGAPGNLDPILRDFKHNMDCIYLMAGDKKDLDQKVITKTKNLLLAKYTGSDREINYFLEVFEEFKNELFKKNMLRRG